MTNSDSLSLSAVPGEWKHPPEPLPLNFEDIAPQQYPIDALGSILGPLAHRCREVVQAPDAICGQSLLAAATLVVSNLVDVTIDGRQYPTSEFFVSIAESGERKSAIDRVALSPIRKHEDKSVLIYAEQEALYGLKKTAYTQALKGIEASTPDEQAVQIRGLLQPLPPMHPEWTFSDPTYEGLFRFLQQRPNAGIFSDEGGQLLSGYAMSPEVKGRTATGFSKMWDGDSLARVRGGDGLQRLRGRRVSMHLMVQPGMYSTLFSDPMLRDQGLLSRILAAYPESLIGTRPYQDVDILRHPSFQQYESRMSQLLAEELPIRPGSFELTPKPMQLSAEAKLLWVQFYQYIETSMARGSRFASIRGFASKAAEHALRLAAVLAKFDGQVEVTQDAVARAIQLALYYLNEAVRARHPFIKTEVRKNAEDLLDWISKQPAKEELPIREMQQYAPKHMRKNEVLRPALELLIEHGYLVEVKRRVYRHVA